VNLPQRWQAFTPDEEHPETSVLPFQRLGRKWRIEAPPPKRVWPPTTTTIMDWKLLGILSERKPPPSDEEVFQRAAAMVDQKIKMDRKILGGAPCIAGTRIPVYAILQLVEAGYSHKRILKSFPSLTAAGLEAALRFSAIVMER
jgi:uncharacterized protein (DUF433 family)